MKSTAIQVNQEEYLDTAVSKGMTEHRLLYRHMLKNTLCPYVTSLCMQFGNILAGAMMVEIVFSWKGMGTLIYDSVNAKDFPYASGLFSVYRNLLWLSSIFLANVLYTVIDPRVKGGMRNEV